MRVLVTGAAGYVGSVLCEHLLDAGHRVCAVDSLRYKQQSLLHLFGNHDFEFIRGDVRDRALMADLVARNDAIMPLAAIVGAPACDRDPEAARTVNFESVRLLDSLRGEEQLVVFPVTNSGYGAQSGEVYCTEETPLQPLSLYGRTKVEAEKVLLERGRTITLRLATVFGMSARMRLDLLVNHFVYAAVTDGSLVIFEKDFKRNFVHIRDVADCFVHCIEHAEAMSGRPYNVGLDEANLSKGELAEQIRAHVPGFYVHFAEIARDPDKRNYIVSNERLRNAGFEARRSLDEGIRELIRGYAMIQGNGFSNL